MSEWYYRLDSDLTKAVTFGNTPYEPGQEFTTSDACEMQRFRAAFREQSGRDLREDQPGAVEMLDRLCPLSEAGVGDTGNQHDQPEQIPAPPDRDGAPGSEGDDARTLGSPEVDTGGSVGTNPAGPGDADERSPAKQLYDGRTPAREEDVEQRLLEQGVA